MTIGPVPNIKLWSTLKCSHLFSVRPRRSRPRLQERRPPTHRQRPRKRRRWRQRQRLRKGRRQPDKGPGNGDGSMGMDTKQHLQQFCAHSPLHKCSNSRIERGSLMTPGITHDIVGEDSRARVLNSVYCLAVSPNRSPPRKKKADDPMSRALHGCNCGKKNAEMRDLQGCFASLMIWECFHVS